MLGKHCRKDDNFVNCFHQNLGRCLPKESAKSLILMCHVDTRESKWNSQKLSQAQVLMVLHRLWSVVDIC